MDRQNGGASPAIKTRQNLPQSISECLIANIDNGILAPGMILLNSELARFFNVSRIPVNEAMQHLTEKGKVEKRAAQGYIVSGDKDNEIRVDISNLIVPKNLVCLFDRQPSWERIYGEIEQDLVALMPYGSFRINESAMTNHYGVNRGVIQQVITRLCERGIVEKPSQSNCNLLAYDEQFLRDRYELRALLEPAALLSSAPHLDMKHIYGCIKAHKNILKDFDHAAEEWLPKLEIQMHSELISKCTNERILKALSSTQMPLVTTTKMTRRLLGNEAEVPLVHEHLAVLQPLADRDFETAAGALRDHMIISIDRSIERLPLLAAVSSPAIPSFLKER